MFGIDDIINAFGGSQAAGQQEQQIQNAMAMQQQMYGQGRSDMMPFLEGGQNSLAQLLKLMQGGAFNSTVNPQNLYMDPGYQFRMQQGQQALERSAAARGGLNSGALMKGMDQYSQGLASQEFNNAFQRQQQANAQKFGQYMGLVGMGQNAAQNMGMQGANYANAMSGLYGDYGNAQAAGTKAMYGGIAGAIGDVGNLGIMAATGGLGAPAATGADLGGIAPSATELYDSHPGNYSLGNFGTSMGGIPGQGLGGY